MSGFLKRSNTINPAGGINPAQEPNVGQYGWTSFDANNVNQIIEYVNLCKKYADSAKDSADYVDSKFEELQAFIVYIEKIYNHIGPIFSNIEIIHKDIIQKHTEVVSMHTDVSNSLIQVLQAATDAHNSAMEAHGEAVKSEASADSSAASATSAETSAVGAAASAKAASDIAEELRKGQVYRGTWNIEVNAGYPTAPDTNSVWDVTLKEGNTAGYRTSDGILWYWGDRLLYLKDENKFSQIESGSTVISVNGKAGAVTLTAVDVGALSADKGVLLEPLKVGNAPNNIQNLSGTNMIRSGGAGSHATVVGNNQGRTYIDSPDEVFILRVGGTTDRRVYTEGFKPTAADVGALGKTGTQTLNGELRAIKYAASDPYAYVSATRQYQGMFLGNTDNTSGRRTIIGGGGAVVGDGLGTVVIRANGITDNSGEVTFNPSGLIVAPAEATLSTHLANKAVVDKAVKVVNDRVDSVVTTTNNAMPKTGGVFTGEVFMQPPQGASPLNLRHTPITAGANALGLMGWNQSGTTREWGVGMYYLNGEKKYAYIGKGEEPWTTGIKLYDTKVETPGNLIVEGDITCSAGLTITGKGNVQAMTGGFLRCNSENVMSMDGKNYTFITGPLDAHMCSNAYWDGAAWRKYNNTNPSMYAVANQAGEFLLRASNPGASNPSELRPLYVDRVGNATFGGEIHAPTFMSTGRVEGSYMQVRNSGNPSIELHDPGKNAVMMYKPQGTGTVRFASSNGAGGEAVGYAVVDNDGYATVNGRFRSHYEGANRSWAGTGQCHFYAENSVVGGNGTLFGVLGKYVTYHGHFAVEQYYGQYIGNTNVEDIAHCFIGQGGGYLRQWFLYNGGRLQSPAGGPDGHFVLSGNGLQGNHVNGVDWYRATGSGNLEGSLYGGYGGLVAWATASFAPASDERLKTVLGESTKSALDVVDQFQFKKFAWNEEAGETYTSRPKKVTDIGLIAQEVEAIDPNFVKDVKTAGEDGVDVKSLDTASLLAVALKAIQEQQVQINELKEKLNEFILK